MLKASLRNLAAHRLRMLMTAFAVILSVAFISGTFIFTDSLKSALKNLTGAGVADVTVSKAQDFETPFRDDARPATIPESLTPKLAADPDVAVAVPWLQVRNVSILGPDRKPVGGNQGPGSSGQIQSWIDDEDLSQLSLDSGQAPQGPDQVVLEKYTAEQAQVVLGQKVPVLLPDGNLVEPTVVGIATRSLSGGVGAGPVASFALPAAQRLLDLPGQVTAIKLTARDGVSQGALARSVEPLLGDGLQAKTGQQVQDDSAARLDEQLGFLNTFLLAFALIALFVAAFLIYNTFSMLVAQRTRELALFRVLGATGRQVTTAVLLEAVVLGVVATLLGLVLGAGVALGLRELFSALGTPLPGRGLVFAPRTVLVAFIVGVGVTTVSAWVPARRAARVPPVAALRADASLSSSSLRIRGWVGAILVLASVASCILALQRRPETDAASQILGLAALAGLVGALALAPILAKPVIQAISWPFRRNVIGEVAAGNTERSPRRTAATAGALMIGLALMSALTVLAASTTKSTDAVVDDVIGADYVVFGLNFRPFPAAVQPAVAAVPGVEVATAVRSAVAQLPGTTDRGTLVTGVDPNAIDDVVNLNFTAGGVAGLSEPGTTLVDTKTARQAGVTVGRTVTARTLDGEKDLRVVGLFDPAGPYNGYVTSLATVKQLGAPDLDSAIYIRTSPGADQAAVRAQLDEVLTAFPSAQLQDQTQFKEQIRDQVNGLLVFILALLVLAVFIAFLGIVNTLALSVFERTREIGLLRAVGSTRGQVRRMVALESVFIAVFGALLGVALGITFGVLLQRILVTEGITELAVNPPAMVGYVALSAVGGVVAALWPAWRASRMDVLAAIATE